MHAPPVPRRWSATRSSSWAGGPATPSSWSARPRSSTAPAWHDGDDIPVPGDHLTAASDRSYLYAVGGRKFTSSNNTNAVQRYDPATDQWTTLPPLPKPVSGAGAAIIDGQLLVAGGEEHHHRLSTVQAYDLTAPTATWTTLPSLTRPATASPSPPSATPSTPSAAPPNPDTPHPPTPSEH